MSKENNFAHSNLKKRHIEQIETLNINCFSNSTSKNDNHAVESQNTTITQSLICKPINFGLFMATAYVLGVISAVGIYICKIYTRCCKKKENKTIKIIKRIENSREDETQRCPNVNLQHV